VTKEAIQPDYNPDRAIEIGKLSIVPEDRCGINLDKPEEPFALTPMFLTLIRVLDSTDFVPFQSICHECYVSPKYNHSVLQATGANNEMLDPKSTIYEKRVDRTHKLHSVYVRNQLSALSALIGDDAIISDAKGGHRLSHKDEVSSSFGSENDRSCALEFGRISIDSITGNGFVDGKSIHLSPKNIAILFSLGTESPHTCEMIAYRYELISPIFKHMSNGHAKLTLSKVNKVKDIINAIDSINKRFQLPRNVTNANILVHISHLRKIVGDDVIVNIPYFGYMLAKNHDSV